MRLTLCVTVVQNLFVKPSTLSFVLAVDVFFVVIAGIRTAFNANLGATMTKLRLKRTSFTITKKGTTCLLWLLVRFFFFFFVKWEYLFVLFAGASSR